MITSPRSMGKASYSQTKNASAAGAWHTRRVSERVFRWAWVRSPGIRICAFIQIGKRRASIPVTERMPVMPLGPTVTISPERIRPR